MQIIKSFIKLLVFIFPVGAMAQSTYLPQGSKEYQFIERLEIKQQRNTDLNFSTLKPYSRKFIVQEVEFLDSARLGFKDSVTGQDKYKEWTDLNLSNIDEYNMQSLLMNNSEWVTGPKDRFISKKPFLKTFYQTKPNMIEVNTKDFFLVVNPVIQIHQAIEPGYDQAIFLNSRGITARGMISKKIGFSTTITDNQERGPRFFQEYVKDNKAVPGNGFYKAFKSSGVDYFDGRGYFTFNVAKYIDVQFGYDKNFIGNGYRSLFLSDWGNSNLFLKLNTKIWKLNYQNLFMELMPQYDKSHGDLLFDRKYAAMHHLSMNVTKWLNIGLFEGVIFGRKNHFDFQYLNPIIFYRHVEGTIGSPDNALAGFDFKANVAHKLQFYGQFLLDEFKLDKVKENKGWWANKWGLQGGMKYIDAFGLNNLDIQLEANIVRPFTYSHGDSISNYTHYNQPLAHPLGANFKEAIAIIKYQPAPKWYITASLLYYTQGLDSLSGYNSGSDIFRSNNERYTYIRINNGQDIVKLNPAQPSIDDGYQLGGGQKATCLNTTFQVSYEWKENLYFDVSFQYRDYQLQNNGSSNTSIVTAGIRLNVFKRSYDF